MLVIGVVLCATFTETMAVTAALIVQSIRVAGMSSIGHKSVLS
jgi:hypothetical protein